MKYYYEVFHTEGAEVFFSETLYAKDDVVVVPVSDEDFVVGKVQKRISTTRGLKCEVDYGEVLPIIQKCDVEAYVKSRQAKAKMAQIQSVLNSKMAEIKAMETLEKFAGKDQSFASLLNEFKALQNGQITLTEDDLQF